MYIYIYIKGYDDKGKLISPPIHHRYLRFTFPSFTKDDGHRVARDLLPSFFFPRKKFSLRACTHTYARTHAYTHVGGHKSSSVRRIINSWTRIGVSSRMPRETRRPPG